MDFSDFNFTDFRVVVQGVRAVTHAEMRIYPTKIDFNAIAAAEMGYPAFARMFISPDASRIIVGRRESTPSPSIRSSSARRPARCGKTPRLPLPTPVLRRESGKK